jgi:hypothetical protein
MAEWIEYIRAFYLLDGDTFLLLAFMSGAVCYFIKNKLNNPASVVILAPFFLFIAATTYSLAMHMQMFSPKRPIEWLTYTSFSASIGAIMGILCVAVLRLVQDRFITASHIRATLRRDEEQAARGYPQVDA